MFFSDIFFKLTHNYSTFNSVHKCFYTLLYTYALTHTNQLAAEKSCPVHVFHGVPEAPCVGPKYYTQTVAITSKPEIPHSTFLIPATRLLSWAPHEEPLLEREGSCISLTLCLSVCVSVDLLPSLSLSLRPYISHCHILCLWLSCSVYLSISHSAGLSLSPLLIPPLLRCALSPTLPLSFSTVLHLLVYFFLYLAQFSVSVCLCLFLATRLLLCFLLLSLCPSLSVSCCLSLRLSLPLCLQIFM